MVLSQREDRRGRKKGERSRGAEMEEVEEIEPGEEIGARDG